MSSTSSLAEGLVKAEKRITTHMNEDHAQSVLAYAHCYTEHKTATAATMTGLTEEGFILSVTMPNADGGTHTVSDVLVKYTKPLATAAGVRKIAVAMHFEAFKKLGFGYRCRHGYYVGAAKMVIHHTGGAKVWGTAAAAALAAAAYYSFRPVLAMTA